MIPTTKAIYLSESDQVVIGGAKVLGYDPDYDQPLIDFGAELTTLEQARRQAWDENEERFTEDEVKKIWKAVERLKVNA